MRLTQVPENQFYVGLCENIMTNHQRRVQTSLEQLSLPKWYKPTKFTALRHNKTESGWKRHLESRQDTKTSSFSYWSTSSKNSSLASSNSSLNSRLRSCSSSRGQRHGTKYSVYKDSSQNHSTKDKTVNDTEASDAIKEVTEAIVEFCQTSMTETSF